MVYFRFNEVSADVYKDYTISLAYDLAQTKQKLAFSDHSDIVSRRMGFIPLPLGVVMLRVIYTSVKSTNPGAVAVAVMAYICLFTFRVLGSIVILGKACDLIDEHKAKQEKKKISVDECRPQVPPKQTEDKKFSVEELNPAPVPLVHQRVETILHKTKEDQELFQLPDQSSERLFLFQNSCEDRSDVILTNMNSAMIDDDEDTNDNILDESETECTRLSDTSELDEENHKDSSNLTPESLLLSPAAKAKSLSSPDLLRREAEDWEDEEEESILVTAQGSMLSPQTFLPHLESGVRKRDTPGT